MGITFSNPDRGHYAVFDVYLNPIFITYLTLNNTKYTIITIIVTFNMLYRFL